MYVLYCIHRDSLDVNYISSFGLNVHILYTMRCMKHRLRNFRLMSFISTLHRWARLLKQQSSITIYCLSTKENKLPFPVSVAANKRKLSFSVNSIFLCGILKDGDGNMETWRHRHGDMKNRNVEK